MPIPFPRAAVAIIRFVFHFVATGFADKNPRFAFFYLNAKKRCFFNLTEFANFSFHPNF
jgi:hypothetical protein